MSAEKRQYYSRALVALIPDGVGYSIDDSMETFEDIIWASGTPAITKELCHATADQLAALEESNAHQRKRFFEYPPLRDFVDAYYWAQKGDNTKMDEYISKVDAVKEKYPKGQ